jgi:hypothetical protein
MVKGKERVIVFTLIEYVPHKVAQKRVLISPSNSNISAGIVVVAANIEHP